MKIKKVTEDEIIFTNGKCIYYSHEQDCCEYCDFIDDKLVQINPEKRECSLLHIIKKAKV